MPTPPIQLPAIADAERPPLVEPLWALIEARAGTLHRQAETIQRLRDEIAVLKGEKPKPTVKPSGRAKQTDPDVTAGGDGDGESKGQRPGSAKRHKPQDWILHEECPIPPREVPAGARFQGYRDVVVQELKIAPHHTRYRLEVWQTPAGEYRYGELPPTRQDGHCGPGLRAYVRYQHQPCHVAQPLLRAHRLDWGLDLAAGQIDGRPSGHNEPFFDAQDRRLEGGLAVRACLAVEESGARHQGRNGYLTPIGHDCFAWFSRTASKSRINLLQLLHAGTPVYRRNDEALGYGCEQGLPPALCHNLLAHPPVARVTTAAWETPRDDWGLVTERHRRIATAGALLGGLFAKGRSHDVVIVRDGAGPFALRRQAWCWGQADRRIPTLIPLNESHRQDQERGRDERWTRYADLKAYPREPDPAAIDARRARFDALVTQQTSCATLNNPLKRRSTHQSELLLVRLRPDVPPQTNGRENDIRGVVKWRKVSGGTRSDLGRRCRDTLASLKQTGRNLGLSFWDYLNDRIGQVGAIPPLPEIVRERASAAETVPGVIEKLLIIHIRPNFEVSPELDKIFKYLIFNGDYLQHLLILSELFCLLIFVLKPKKLRTACFQAGNVVAVTAPRPRTIDQTKPH